MNDLQQLQQAKEQCIDELGEALPRYRERLDAANSRLALYIEDALTGHASHANLYELLGIRKVFRLMDSYDLDPEPMEQREQSQTPFELCRVVTEVGDSQRVQRTLRARRRRHVVIFLNTNFPIKREQCQIAFEHCRA